MKHIQMLSLVPANDAQRERLQAAAPHVQITYCLDAEIPADVVAGAEIIFGNLPRTLLPNAASLRWLSLKTAGADLYTQPGVLPPDVLLTNSVGAYGLTVSEHMLATLFAALRKLPRYFELQQQHCWQSAGEVRSIEGSTILVLGLGDIGGSFARKVKALGAYTIGVRRSLSDCPEWLDELHTIEELDELLPRADVVAAVLPANAQSRNLFTGERFARMRKNALIMNVGRGAVINTSALTEALANGIIGGACIDTVDPEPLPPEHPLWSMDNVILTPHVAGSYFLPETLNRVVNIMCENLQHYFAGEPLRNLVSHA